jgi:hypothetical protein
VISAQDVVQQMTYNLFLIFLTCIGISFAALCVPEPFNTILYQTGSCPENIPMKLVADQRGMQITTTLDTCADNMYDIYVSFLGNIPELTLGDYFEYTLWWEEEDTQCIVDLYYFNGTGNTLRDKESFDQNGVQHHPLVKVRTLCIATITVSYIIIFSPHLYQYSNAIFRKQKI